MFFCFNDGNVSAYFSQRYFPANAVDVGSRCSDTDIDVNDLGLKKASPT